MLCPRGDGAEGERPIGDDEATAPRGGGRLAPRGLQAKGHWPLGPVGAPSRCKGLGLGALGTATALAPSAAAGRPFTPGTCRAWCRVRRSLQHVVTRTPYCAQKPSARWSRALSLYNQSRFAFCPNVLFTCSPAVRASRGICGEMRYRARVAGRNCRDLLYMPKQAQGQQAIELELLGSAPSCGTHVSEMRLPEGGAPWRQRQVAAPGAAPPHGQRPAAWAPRRRAPGLVDADESAGGHGIDGIGTNACGRPVPIRLIDFMLLTHIGLLALQ